MRPPYRCPICKVRVKESEYLGRVFSHDPWVRFAANLTTHYRHGHIRHYDRTWQNSNYARKSPLYRRLGYEGFKISVNNRAKRQLIRATTKAWKPATVRKLLEGFAQLQHNDEPTKALIREKNAKVQGLRILDEFAPTRPEVSPSA